LKNLIESLGFEKRVTAKEGRGERRCLLIFPKRGDPQEGKIPESDALGSDVKARTAINRLSTLGELAY